MKKIGLLLLLLCGCAPNPTIRDPACSKAEIVKVIRVLDDMILAWVDVAPSMSVYSPTVYYKKDDEHYVYLKKEPFQVYYPGQIIQLPKSSCIKYAGSYSYVVDNQYGVKTLKGSFEQAEYPNPEYEALMDEQFEKANTSR